MTGVVLGIALAFVGLVGWVALTFGDSRGRTSEVIESSYEPIEAHVRENGFVDPWFHVHLRRDNGLFTRENEIAELGEISPTVEFTAPGEVRISIYGTTYTVFFNSTTMDVTSTRCDEQPTVTDWGEYTYSCPRP